jgi:hypothetical protein
MPGDFILPGFLDAPALGLEFLALEPLGDFRLQHLDDIGKVLAQQPPLACRQAQRQGPFGCIEIVQIA